jgi:hypothetical protein
MTKRFDDLSRSLAGSTSRRGVLKLMGAAVVGGTAAAVLRPFHAGGAVCGSGTTPCGTGCCPAGVACVDPATNKCGCPAGRAPCGSHCCPNKGDFCAFATPGGCDACCPRGTTGCDRFCCDAGVACVRDGLGNKVCGCAAGTTSCIDSGSGQLKCCPGGQACPADLSSCPATTGGTLNHCLP